MSSKIIKSTVVYTILGFLPLSFAFFFTPIYLKYLSPKEYGVLNLFNIYSGILAYVYTLGVSPAFGFLYWDYYKNKEELNKFIASTIGIILILQTIIFVLGLIFGEQILHFILKSNETFSFYPFGVLTLIYPISVVFYDFFSYYNRNEENIKNYVYLSVSTLVFLTIGSIIGLVVLELKAEGAIWGRTIGYSIIVLSYLFYFIYKVGISFNKNTSSILLKFGFPLMLSTIIGGISFSMDRILVERFFSLEELGIYGLAIVIVSLIEVWFNALNNALSPTIYKYMVDDIEKNNSKIRTLSHTIVIAVLFTIVILIFISKPIIEFIAPKDYYGALKYVPILSIAFIVRVFSTLKSYIFYLHKKTKIFPMIQTIILFLIVIFGYILSNIMGIIGIVYAVLSVKILELIIVTIIANKVYFFSFKFNRMYILSLMCLVSVLIICNYENDNNFYYSIPLLTFLIFAPIVAFKELKDIYITIVKK